MTKALTSVQFWEDCGQGGKHLPSWWDKEGRELQPMLRRILALDRGGSILEMGCGNSYWLPWFARELGLRVYGIDFAGERLKKARRNLMMANVSARQIGGLVCGDFHFPPPQWEGAMDVVYSNGVIEHFDNTVATLRCFASYLQVGGQMVTVVPYFKGLWGWVAQRVNKGVLGSYMNLDLDDVVRAHQEAGLRIEYASYWRWGDAGVLNYNGLPLLLRRVCYGVITGVNLFLSLSSRLKKWLPEALYSSMIVVAVNHRQLKQTACPCPAQPGETIGSLTGALREMLVAPTRSALEAKPHSWQEKRD